MNNRSRRFSAKGLLQQDKNSAITRKGSKGRGRLAASMSAAWIGKRESRGLCRWHHGLWLGLRTKPCHVNLKED